MCSQQKMTLKKKPIFFSSASSHVPCKKKGVKKKIQKSPSSVSPKKKNQIQNQIK
jgi:hypothetical protein